MTVAPHSGALDGRPSRGGRASVSGAPGGFSPREATSDPRSCGGFSSRVATSRRHAANVGLVHRRVAGEPPLGGQLAVTHSAPSRVPYLPRARVLCGRARGSRGRQRITRAGRASGWVGWARPASASSRLPTSSESATSGAAPAAPRPNLSCRPPPPPPPPAPFPPGLLSGAALSI